MSTKERKRYRVTGLLTMSVSTVVFAKSADAAIAIAVERPVVSLCHQCANGEDTEEWVTSGSLDGDVVEEKAELE